MKEEIEAIKNLPSSTDDDLFRDPPMEEFLQNRRLTK
jgi:hypothetical protein